VPGTFSKSNRPSRPGAYFNFESESPLTIPVSTGSIVAIPYTHDWGPYQEGVLYTSYAEWIAVNGNNDSVGHRAVKQAFQGEGRSVGRGGAGAVLGYRHGDADAAKADLTIKNTAAADAITITALYEGTKGNGLNVTSTDYAPDSTKAQLIVYLDNAEVERFVYTDADVADLVSQINSESNWLVAELLVGGTALRTDVSSPALTANTDLTGGDDGDAAITQGIWEDTLDALGAFRFGIFCPAELADSGTLEYIQSWSDDEITGLNNTGKRFLTVVGGSYAAGSGQDDETMADAVARSAVFNSGNFVNLGAFAVRDLDLIDSTTDDPYELTSSQFAPRFAGVLANRGEAVGATFARFENVELVYGPSDADMTEAFDGGVVALARGTDPVAPVRVERSVTTYTTKDDSTKPYSIYRNPKYVRTMHGIENETTEWLESSVIGQLVVNDKVRDGIIAEVTSRLEARVQATIIQPKPTVIVDPDPPPSDDDEFIALVYGIKFGRSLEQVFSTVRVG